MNSEQPDLKLRNLQRRCDQMVTQHSFLRDYYSIRASALDIVLLIMSATLSSVVLAPPDLLAKVAPVFISPFVPGILSVGVFLASVISWKVDWKGKENAHKEAAKLLASFKQKSQDVLNNINNITADGLSSVFEEYRIVTEKCVEIPERFFLKTKQHHKRKVQLSMMLDATPYANLLLLKLKLGFSDNFKGLKK